MSIQDRELAFLLGLPFNVMTMDDTIEDARTQIESRRPGYFITANADFIAQAYTNEKLKDILFHADRVVCDGMPLIWLSRYFKPELPERVAGSDMVFRLFTEAQTNQWKVYFLGSDETTLQQTKQILEQRYPDIKIVGTCSPPYGPVESWPNDQIMSELADSKPDLLLVAVGCPKQEYWIAEHYRESGVPLSIGIGASLDFICGTQTRAPLWIQRIGMEWFWRLATNPKRLVKRYAKDLYYLLLLANRQRQLTSSPQRTQNFEPRFQEEAFPQTRQNPAHSQDSNDAYHLLSWQGEVERSNLEAHATPPDYEKPVLLDLRDVTFIDSSGIGRLAKIARESRAAGGHFSIIHPSTPVEKIIKAMHLETQLPSSHDKTEALQKLNSNQ